jgi:hypothetical protein
VAVLASVGLVDDAGHQGLFNVSGLTPGRSSTRCVQVDYAGPTPAGVVYFSATDVSGPLAANLQIKVEQGAGGSFATCTGFVSSAALYDGSLINVVDADPAAPRTTTGWSPAATDERTYRVTATLGSNVVVQNQHSTATFRWFLVGGPTFEPSDPATTDPAVAEAAPTAAATSPAPLMVVATPAPPSSGPPATRRPAAAAAPSPTTPAPTREPAPAEDAGTVAKVKKALADLGRDLTEVAVRTSTHSALPFTGLFVLVGFLTVQNRIDRLDPKLALAPTTDPHLVFTDPDEPPVDLVDLDPRLANGAEP